MSEDKLAEFWEQHYRENRTPWDAGQVPLDVKNYLANEKLKGSILVPGCGRGYEVRFFAENGVDTYAMDLSSIALTFVKEHLKPYTATLWQGNFLDFDFGNKKFDYIYERTFLCALNPHYWPRYVEQMAHLLKPNGLLFGYYLYWETNGGPPFGLKFQELDSLLGKTFHLLERKDVFDSIPAFVGKEKWEVWQRI